MTTSPTLAAVAWLQDALLSTAATAVAIIAVATVGLMALAGRLDLRRGATVIIGCFIIFGAATIAAGLRSVAGSGTTIATPPPRIGETSPPPLPAKPSAYDPYAGAAVPQR